jgi:hypothetical protein
MGDHEWHDWAHFAKLHREWDGQFEERRKQGLPLRLGIIPQILLPFSPVHTRNHGSEGAFCGLDVTSLK